MTFRQLHVTKADGRTSIEATVEDSPVGRRELDRLAFAALERADVVAAHAVPVARIAQTVKGLDR